jgi:hypothetical protein
MPRTRPKTIEERLESMEIMLAAILNRLAAAPDSATSMKEFVAAGKAQGLKMVEILNKWNERENR